MAHLWMLGGEEEWNVFSLAGERFGFRKILETRPGSTEEMQLAELPLLVRARDGNWVLLCRDDGRVQVNGLPPAAGVRALRHKDRIHVPGLGALFLSTEELPEIRPYPGAKAGGHCPRCSDPLLQGSPAVCCPGCAIWYHQGDRPCWDLGTTCIFCECPTDLAAGFRFVPEAL